MFRYLATEGLLKTTGVELWRSGNAMFVKLKRLVLCITLLGVSLTGDMALAKVGDTYYCEKTGGRVLFDDGKSFDYFAILKNDGRPLAFLVEHSEKVLHVKSADFKDNFMIVYDNLGTDIRSLSLDGQSHLVIWLQYKDGFSFTLTRSSPTDLKAEVGFCKIFN